MGRGAEGEKVLLLVAYMQRKHPLHSSLSFFVVHFYLFLLILSSPAFSLQASRLFCRFVFLPGVHRLADVKFLSSR